MRVIFFLSIYLFVLSFTLQSILGRSHLVTQKGVNETVDAQVLGESTLDLRRLFRVFLSDNGTVRTVTLQSYEAPVWADDPGTFDWRTDMEVTGKNYSRFSFYGWLSSAYSVDLEGDGWDELVVEVITGKTVGTVVYRFVDGILSRIPTSEDILGPRPSYGISSRVSPEFKDVDGDGILEMLAYYRFFPPEEKRKVEVYKFTGVLFQKIKEYEEKMPEVYL